MKNIWLLGLLMVPVVSSFGHEPVCCDLPTTRLTLTGHRVVLQPGESKTIYVPDGWRRVEKLYFDASSDHGTSTMQVVVNGDTKAKLHVPTHQPSYVVTVHETTSSIQLWNRGWGTVTVRGIEADVEEKWTHPVRPRPTPPKPIPFPTLNEAARFAHKAIDLVDDLRPFADPETEFLTYLLPIKKVAGRALAKANARGVGSKIVRENLEALQKQIAFAEPYIETTLKKDASFDLVVELISLKEAIEDWLD